MIVTIRNKEVLIDDSCKELYENRVWHISDTGYLMWRGILKGKKQTIRFHREVIEAKPGEIVDHINRNKLDNRQSNLRICTQSDNVRNSDRYEKARHYYFDTNHNCWFVDSRTYNIKCKRVDSEADARKWVDELSKGNYDFKPQVKELIRRNKKLYIEDVKKVHELYSQGMFQKDIAKIYGMTQSAMSRILSGECYKGVKKESENGQA